MRADRLVALLMLLQTRGRLTAAQAAEELEVSERTARRDLEALGMAGVPVYSRPGRNGGWELVGGARTDLSGLTGPEARALFLVAGPSSSVTPQVKNVLRKLVRALPESFRSEAEAATNAVHVDPAAWGRTRFERPPPEYLEVLQRAVVQGIQVRLDYVARDRAATTRIVHPLGLASKGWAWYLVADTEAGLRSFRVDRVQAVTVTSDPVVRPEGFDLAEAWALIADEVDRKRTPYWARATAAIDVIPILRMNMGTRVRIGGARTDGRVEVEIGGHAARSLAAEIAGYGAAIEIIEPEEIRGELARIGLALADQYAPPSTSR